MIITPSRGLIGLFFIAVGSLYFSLVSGSFDIHFTQLIQLLSEKNHSLAHDIIVDIRLPRTLNAFVVGGLLALAGTMMQVLLRNPLADPYILGISGGSAVGTLLLAILGITGYGLALGAWLGSLVAVSLVFALVSLQGRFHPDRLLLTGIALACGWSAIISLILITCPDKTLHSLLFWLMGDLNFANHLPIAEGSLLIIAVIYSYSFATELNILIRGEQEAKALGVQTFSLTLRLFFISSLLTATAVSIAGCIGFIGLVVPHLLRLLGGYHHRFLLPASVLLGGSFLTVADTLSRTLFSPQQLPVGIMMALIGVPLFIFLLYRNKTWSSY